MAKAKAGGEGNRPIVSHVRASTDIADMLSWIWYCERDESGESLLQITDLMLRAQVTKRYGDHLEKIKQIAKALGRKFEPGKVPLPPLKQG